MSKMKRNNYHLYINKKRITREATGSIQERVMESIINETTMYIIYFISMQFPLVMRRYYTDDVDKTKSLLTLGFGQGRVDFGILEGKCVFTIPTLYFIPKNQNIQEILEFLQKSFDHIRYWEK